MAARIVHIGKEHRTTLLELGDLSQPVSAQSHLDAWQQSLKRCGHIGIDGDVSALDLVQLGAIDINVDDLCIGAELCGTADRTVIEARTHADQEIGLFECEVGVARSVHAEHAERQGMVHRHRAQRHQRHGRRQAALLGQMQGQ